MNHNGEKGITKDWFDEREIKFSNFVDNTDDLVTVVNKAGQFVYVNQVSKKIYGIEPDDLIGRSAFEFIHEEDRAATQEAFGRWLQEKIETVSHENRQVAADGTVRNMLWTIMLQYDDDGASLSFWSIARDITERMKIEDALRIKNQVFENSIASQSIADKDGIITHVNPAFLQMWGYAEKKKAIGNSIGSFFANPTDANPVLEALGASDAWQGEFLAARKDGTTFISRGFATSLRNAKGELIGYQSTTIDVTQEKEAEALLKEAIEALERSNKELEQFAYVASHDLQEPLRMVASYTELLADRYAGRLDEKADKYIAYAVDGARRMQQLINDLLAFSRIGTRVKPFEAVDCSEMMADILNDLSQLIKENGAEVTAGELPTVQADRTQLRQLFQNLIENAIKFHGEEPPEIELSANRDNQHWMFSVKDHGIGIDPQFFDRIFTVFQRLHPRGAHQGNGIGLSIAKKIVERHNGRIWVESAPGKGACFMFTLPALKDQEG